MPIDQSRRFHRRSPPIEPAVRAARLVPQTADRARIRPTMLASEVKWTNPSVLAFAKDGDPIRAIEEAVRELTLRALDKGWIGPPYDPFALAGILGYEVGVSDEVRDAKATKEASGKPTIVFNPSQPHARIRFSIAHEIIHTLFPDFADEPRYRLGVSKQSDAWQLEMLCNVGAAELLMPVESLEELSPDKVTIDWITEQRRRLNVSTEAMLLRVVRLADFACAAFCASRLSAPGEPTDIRLDYAVTSRAWKANHAAGPLRSSPVIGRCTAIKYTSKGVEEWPLFGEPARIECIGLPGYGGQLFPRVAGIAIPTRELPRAAPTIEYLTGDATKPADDGERIIVQIVNNRTSTWSGGGFPGAIKRKWPAAQRAFHEWVANDKQNLTLGRSHVFEVEPRLRVVSMVAQAGFGESAVPRLKYEALRDCLRSVGDLALAQGASVHMPRIGTGQAGGSWDIVRGLVEEEIALRGPKVCVYDLPGSPSR